MFNWKDRESCTLRMFLENLSCRLRIRKLELKEAFTVSDAEMPDSESQKPF